MEAGKMRKRREGEKGGHGREEGGEGRRNLAYTVISKSRRL